MADPMSDEERDRIEALISTAQRGGLKDADQLELARLAQRATEHAQRLETIADVLFHAVDETTDPGTWHPALEAAYAATHSLLSHGQWEPERLADAAEAIGLPIMIPGLAYDIVLYRRDDNGNTFEVSRGFDTTVEANAEAERFESRGHRQTYWIEVKRRRTKTP